MAKQAEADQTQKTPRGLALQQGESLVLWARPSAGVTWAKYLYTLGLYSVWRRRHTFVLTDKRILVSKGIFARSERSIPLNRVDDASFVRRGLAAYCEVVVGGGRGSRRVERVGPLAARTARRFARETQARS
jgi:uncharacterized membrane protein YdbT with pleckstrin-like domain